MPGGGCALPGLRSVRLVVNLFTIVAETAGVAASKSLRRSRKAGAARMDAG
ncbi:LysR family transcriptional regulator [Klebsiella pneumoniae]|nr:LysR family transcriptional regulator [Klebsiella pneumoniae]RTA43909.1 LysR family transcriptional regulator [Klebsiella pneumoniae subsp. pneumoniae]MBL2747988.1 LysR family transcriptional regulator [Klebsiella pneumoniae]MBL2759476.1 LysR family transcriptional regulator [Klebsiella pneumoniae]MBL2798678.1 LysR family transcriptional regulator [Klebsiella pneumoniae]